MISIARGIRLTLVVILLGIALIWVWRTKVDAGRASLFVAAVIGSVTTIYVLVTYEILLQNQKMAQAAIDSSAHMERSVRFSHAPNILYETINTKDPTFANTEGSVIPVNNDDYKRALTEFSSVAQQQEFVFAIVRNMGQGSATNLNIEAEYHITDSSNPNRESSVIKQAAVQILEPRKAVALCIFISKIPTANDYVSLVSARMTTSDFYRDAINEAAQQTNVDLQKHHVKSEAGCVVRIT